MTEADIQKVLADDLDAANAVCADASIVKAKTDIRARQQKAMEAAP